MGKEQALAKADGIFAGSGRLVRKSYSESSAACDATLFALANGDLGVRGGLDELQRETQAFLPDGFVKRPIDYHESFVGFARATNSRFPAPSPVRMDVAIDGTPIDFATLDIISHKQTVDPREAILKRRTLWALSASSQLEIKVERCVPFHGGAICISDIAVRLIGAKGKVEVRFPVSDDEPDCADEPDNGTSTSDPRIKPVPGVKKAFQSSLSNAQVTRFDPEPGTDAPPIALAQNVTFPCGDFQPDEQAEVSPSSVAKACADGEWLKICRIVAFGTGDDAEAKAVSLLQSSGDSAISNLKEEHQAALTKFWESADIGIGGEPELEAAIKFNLMHVLMSSSNSADHGIAAKGLTGEGYEGHYFWDTEVFVLPTLALLAPDKARTVLEHRISRLDKARANARELSHPTGAAIPVAHNRWG